MEASSARALESALKGAFIRRSEFAPDNGRMRAAHVFTGGVYRAGRQALTGVALAIALWGGIAPSPASPHDSDDHDRARAAVQAGEVLPLGQVLERLQRTHPGQILEVELDREDGRWIYEVKLLQTGGQLLKLELDARTGEVLEVKRKGARDGRSGKDRR